MLVEKVIFWIINFSSGILEFFLGTTLHSFLNFFNVSYLLSGTSFSIFLATAFTEKKYAFFFIQDCYIFINKTVKLFSMIAVSYACTNNNNFILNPNLVGGQFLKNEHHCC